ncbi:hypothetical protein [Oribacterium sp. WCC10]|uniref:hypothetical protein n=1 Tax=Oribacterium sp. WCC10 TaxID=1855343 RepID=UPI0008ECDA7C|nr:hypothetical protein [Oribacterium sp. WCC10]SFG65645.1 hypothetical protein SAMN05216356_11751 [Oribacterium sp. WCC10]
MAYSAAQLYKILLKEFTLLDFEIALSNNPEFRAVPIRWDELKISGNTVIINHLDEKIVLTQSSFKMLGVRACFNDKERYYPVLFYEDDDVYITFSEIPDNISKDSLQEAVTEDIFYEVCSYKHINNRKKLTEFLKDGYKRFKAANDIENDYDLISETLVGEENP